MTQKVGIVIVLFLIPFALFMYLVLRGGGLALPTPQNHGGLPVVTVANYAVHVEIASTTEARRRGLSGRERLEQDRGMLFVFENAGLHGIWMRDMLMPIDIVWLSSDGTIVDLKGNVVPETYPDVFYPREPAAYVLELSAGFTELHSVNIGDQVTLPSRVLN